MPTLKPPPDQLDGAGVLLWAYSPDQPFFIMNDSHGAPHQAIHGFVVCRYEAENIFYRFSCDLGWNVVNDMDYASLEEAVNSAHGLSGQALTWYQK